MIDLEMNDAFEELPKSMNYTLSFTDLNLVWDKKNKAFVTKGNLGLGNIKKTQILIIRFEFFYA